MASASPLAGPPRPIDRALAPFRAFARLESASGLVLLACTLVALAIANSPWAAPYHALLDTPVGLSAGSHALTLTAHQWIDDGLMAVFFLVVGLEIKRELLVGELAAWRRAALPAAGALGGMVVPALLFTALNAGGDGLRGWGIPMATDIAFALGILALVGRGLPPGLRVFLAALAIVDDLGAVLVIALFYSSQLDWTALGGAGGVVLLLLALNRLGARNVWLYAIGGVALWALVLASGVHATVAGVLLAFCVPARTRIDPADFRTTVSEELQAFRAGDADVDPEEPFLSNGRQQAAVARLEAACEAVQTPSLQLERKLHGLVAFAIMPLFALANAGLHLPADVAGALGAPVTQGVALGLLLGKPVGIFGAAWLTVRLGVAALPERVRWPQLFAMAVLGGIGFTMSLFIAKLAFGEGTHLDEAKLGVLGASTLAAVAGVLLVARGRTTAAA
ncbi:MAG: Na+/H+ antiporter NhaA [Gemmatimonadales bacterium]|nr:Na+/H+ antiporter NhaA [Gemmatimonadales bacterium]